MIMFSYLLEGRNQLAETTNRNSQRPHFYSIYTSNSGKLNKTWDEMRIYLVCSEDKIRI